jgi:hypothetical protein
MLTIVAEYVGIVALLLALALFAAWRQHKVRVWSGPPYKYRVEADGQAVEAWLGTYEEFKEFVTNQGDYTQPAKDVTP